MGEVAKRRQRKRRPGAGRKPLPLAVRQSRKVMVRFTEGDFSALEEAAGDRGVSRIIRAIVLRYLARRRL